MAKSKCDNNKTSNKKTSNSPRSNGNRNRGRQGRKDSSSKRVNYDNTRKDKFEEDITDTKHAKDNDISWYSKNPELMKSAGSIGFSNTTGQPIGIANQFTLPGIMTIGLTPAFGGSNISALQQSMHSYESFVIHANSRNVSYNGRDLMILTLAGGNVYSFLGWITRLYGVMKNYEQVNAYTPRAIVEANGVDFVDCQKNLANMWFDINQMIAEAAQIWIPSTFPIIARWYWMYSNLYTDGTSAKSQIYMFVPEQFLMYDDTDFETGGALVPALINLGVGQTTPSWTIFQPQQTASKHAAVGSSTNLYTWEQLKTVFRSMMDALLNSTYRGVIFGDILKAYGADKIYGLYEIPVDHKVSPVYNQEVLTQIENAVICWPMLGAIGLYQDIEKDALAYFITSGNDAATTAVGIDRSVLNFHFPENPTPEQIMIATRLHVNGMSRTAVKRSFPDSTTGKYSALTDGYDVLPYASGSEIATSAYIYSYVQGSLRSKATGGVVNAGGYQTYYFNSWGFDWCPFVYWANALNQSGITTMGVFGDFDNSVVIDQNDAYKLHNCALYSEFDVPQM